MKMDFRHRNTVNMAFRLCDQPINCHDVILHFFGQRKMPPYDVLDIMQTAVVVVMGVTVVMMVEVVVMYVAMVGVTVVMFVVMVGVAMIMLAAMVMVVIMAAVTVVVTMLMTVVTVAVLVMTVLMVMASFFLTVYRYGHVRSCNAAFYRRLFLKVYAGYTERVEFFYKFIGSRQQFQQCCCQHIAGRTHSAVQI